MEGQHIAPVFHWGMTSGFADDFQVTHDSIDRFLVFPEIL
jgi:hypothetical protein